MPNKTIITSIFIALSILLASCGQTKIGNVQPNATMLPSPVSETEAASVTSLVQTSVSNMNYLKECKTINHNKFTEQIPYQDILPGKTNESELETLLGAPDKVSKIKDRTNWVYGNVGLLIEKGTVTYVLVPVEQTSELTLEQLVLKYGCPDLILAVNSTEDQVGYGGVRFIYHFAGMEVDFAKYPVSLSDKPATISYFPSMDLQEYLNKNSWGTMTIQSGKPVEWTEAVK